MAGWFSRLLSRFRRKRDPYADVSDEFAAVLGGVEAESNARRRALAPLAGIVTAISKALLEADPIGLAADGAPDDEYDPEAETVVMSLADRHEPASIGDVHDVVHAEFVRWFGEDIAGDRDRYLEVSVEVHRLWGEFLAEG
jgi:hypothetical protein